MENTYYKEKLEIIRDLRFNKNLTLQEIGDKFGVSRQRIHQILGNTGRNIKFTYEELIKYKDYTNKEIAEIYGLKERTISIITNRLNIRNKIEGDSAFSKNYKAEELVVNKLKQLNFQNIERFPPSTYYSLIVNNYKIKVLGSFVSRTSNSQRNVSPAWRFSLRLSRGLIDFFALVIYPLEAIFIVPDEVIPDHRKELVFCYPTDYKHPGKWQGYKDKFDLLRD